MTIKNATLTAAAVVLATGLAGCWDATEVTVHNPESTRGRRIPAGAVGVGENRHADEAVPARAGRSLSGLNPSEEHRS